MAKSNKACKNKKDRYMKTKNTRRQKHEGSENLDGENPPVCIRRLKKRRTVL